MIFFIHWKTHEVSTKGPFTLSNPDRNWFRKSVVGTAIRTGSSNSISGVETLLFPAQLSLIRFHYANDVINTVNHTQRHILTVLIWRNWGHERICLRHPTRACFSMVQWCGLVHWRPLLFSRTRNCVTESEMVNSISVKQAYPLFALPICIDIFMVTLICTSSQNVYHMTTYREHVK